MTAFDPGEFGRLACLRSSSFTCEGSTKVREGSLRIDKISEMFVYPYVAIWVLRGLLAGWAVHMAEDVIAKRRKVGRCGGLPPTI
jgi:hypothetical protein